MCTHPKILYLPSRKFTGITEFFYLSKAGKDIVAKRLMVSTHERTELSQAVSPHGSFDSLENLLEPFMECWQEVGRGSKQTIGEIIETFAIPNQVASE